MANEITLNSLLSETLGGVTVALQAGIAITKVGNGRFQNVQTCTTSSAQLSIGGVTTIGYIAFKNLDATNFVSIGSITPAVAGTCQITLKPGEMAEFPTRLTSWYAISDTGNVDVAVLALEL